MMDEITTPPVLLQAAVNALMPLPPLYPEAPVLAAVGIIRVWCAVDPTLPATADETSIFTLVPSPEDPDLRLVLATDTSNQVLDSMIAKHVADFGIEYTREVIQCFLKNYDEE